MCPVQAFARLDAGVSAEKFGHVNCLSCVSWGSNGRFMYFGPGQHIQKPQLSAAATISISSLLFLQLCGIGTLAWLIYGAPSLTTSLDAITVSKLIARLEEEKCVEDEFSVVEAPNNNSSEREDNNERNRLRPTTSPSGSIPDGTHWW